MLQELVEGGRRNRFGWNCATIGRRVLSWIVRLDD